MKFLLLPSMVASFLLSPSLSAETPTVRIKEQSFASLNEALEAAGDGDVLTVAGAHSGNFIIKKPITLRGAEGASLDGKGKGTVLTVAADGVTVENLTITGSGTDSTFLTIWGDAGVQVDGDEAVLQKLSISGCDWGVIFRGSKDGKMTDSIIEGCSRDGIKVLAGEGHTISKCQINRNQTGVLVDAMYEDETEYVMPNMTDMAQMQKMATFSKKATFASKVKLVENKLAGNANSGIQVSSSSNQIEVLRNRVERTGQEGGLDEDGRSAYIKAFSLGAGIPPDEAEKVSELLVGAAILLNCGPYKNKVVGNQCHDNKGMGVGMVVAKENLIEDNDISGNRIGIYVERSNENQLLANHVSTSSEYGIALGIADYPVMQVNRSDANVLSGNQLLENKINAYDGTTEPVSREELVRRMEKFGVPGIPAGMMSNGDMKNRLIDGIHKAQNLGDNQWHDGTKGNYYDDFDEPSEGFKDVDGNGISEAPHPIPGGKAVDPHALATAESR